jgi:hypothetical protein
MDCERLFTDEEHVLVKFFCAAPTTISWLPYLLGSFGSDLIHTSIQIDSVETNLANEIVLPF